MTLLIDNYDSFSYNLYQAVGVYDADIKVVKNDEIKVEDIKDMNPDRIILSPGPGRPENAGICEEVVKEYSGKVPILGVCLGHQAICEAFGSKINYAKELMHGKSSEVKLDTNASLFTGIDRYETVGRYHSLAVDEENLSASLKVVARADDGQIMAVKHKQHDTYGLQFHPESILTPSGDKIVKNFIKLEAKKPEDVAAKEKKEVIKTAIKELINGNDLTDEMMTAVMEEIMTGEATDAQKASFLTSLVSKGETIDEITAAAKVMKNHCIKFHGMPNTLEIVGTGGDGANTINISTLSAIVCAAAGQRIAKHGNRAASSKCGTADCLEELGVNLNVDTDKAEEILKDTGMIFLFAQKYHPAMRFVGSVRKEIGIRTMFNILGPLTNPAGADIQLMGVYAEELVEPLVKVLHNIGVNRAMAVYGTDCMDEISLSAPTKVAEYIDGEYKSYTITPEDFGLTRCEKEDLVGGTPAENATILRDILMGAKGPKRDVVLMNAGAGLYLSGKADSIANGIKLAAETIDSGKALEKLEEFIRVTNS